jgi:hypothetical protein
MIEGIILEPMVRLAVGREGITPQNEGDSKKHAKSAWFAKNKSLSIDIMIYLFMIFRCALGL